MRRVPEQRRRWRWGKRSRGSWRKTSQAEEGAEKFGRPLPYGRGSVSALIVYSADTQSAPTQSRDRQGAVTPKHFSAHSEACEARVFKYFTNCSSDPPKNPSTSSFTATFRSAS